LRKSRSWRWLGSKSQRGAEKAEAEEKGVEEREEKE
jgi:hypothetical protein